MENNKWKSAFVGLCLIIGIVAIILPFIMLAESANERTTREATAFMSTVQPGDTLYWFKGGMVRPLPIVRNLPNERVVFAVVEGPPVYHRRDGGYVILDSIQLTAEIPLSYNEVYQFIVKVVERP